jgi:hypothetical protein
MNEHDLREALDACRPDGDELRQPDMAPLAEILATDPHWQAVQQRSQRWDTALGRAFRDVPVPSDLAARLQAATAAAEPALSTPAAGEISPAASRAESATAPAGWLRQRRIWAGAAVALAAAAAWLVWLGTQPAPLPQLTDDFAREVIGWTDQVPGSTWNQDLAAAAYPLDRAILAATGGWTSLATPYHRQTLVYDLTPPGRGFAYAFCIPKRGRASDLPSVPTPFSDTGGIAIGAWQSQDVVYVLAVRGSRSRYQSFINSRLLIGFDLRTLRPATAG